MSHHEATPTLHRQRMHTQCVVTLLVGARTLVTHESFLFSVRFDAVLWNVGFLHHKRRNGKPHQGGNMLSNTPKSFGSMLAHMES